MLYRLTGEATMRKGSRHGRHEEEDEGINLTHSGAS